MKTNELIQEIHRVRERQAEECGYDVRRMGEQIRRRQRERAVNGVRYASFSPSQMPSERAVIVREEQHKD